MKILILSIFSLLFFTSYVAAQTTYATVENHVGCIRKSDREKITKYAGANDKVAFDKLIHSGRCIILKSGVEVQVMNRTFGLVEIRPIGYEQTLWTASEGVKKK